MQFKQKEKKKIIINITSLIDVMFLLLIFLLISSTFLEQPGIKLELPETKTTEMVKQQEYTLFVSQEGKLFLNKIEIKEDELEKKIKEVLPKMKDKAIILKADGKASHGAVVRIMDIIKRCGVKKLIIGTRIDGKK
jgi:biopolymer transport protein ExbD